MMSLSTINYLAEKAARRAKAKGLYPKQINKATVADDRVREALRSIPFIGDWRPKGYTLVERSELKIPANWEKDRLDYLWCNEPYLFVSKYFDDRSDARALAFSELCELAAENPGLYYAIVEEGQFQVVVGVFK